MYGVERLRDALNKFNADAEDVDKFVDDMYNELDTYAGKAEQADDITMVYVTRA